jgi:hypothetical protein
VRDSARRPIMFNLSNSIGPRHNLTVRTFMKRFARLSPGFSKKLANLEAACGLVLA